MKRKAPFIIAAIVTVLLVANLIASPSYAAVTMSAAPVTNSSELVSREMGVTEALTTATGKTTADPSYILIAMYNGDCITLDCYNHDQRSKAISSPTVLKWPGHSCRDVDLILVGPQQISQIRLVDKNYKYISNISFTVKDKGVTHCHFVMDPKLSGYVHTKEGDDTYVESAEFYFEILSADGKLSYTSIWYK